MTESRTSRSFSRISTAKSIRAGLGLLPIRLRVSDHCDSLGSSLVRGISGAWIPSSVRRGDAIKPRLSTHLILVAWCVSALLVLSTASSWAQGSPALPPAYAESPEFRARLEVAAANSTIKPWQRGFMQKLVGTRVSRGTTDVSPIVTGPADENGNWDEFSRPPTGRFSHTAIYDPVRDRMIVFGGLDGTGYRNDVWALGLSGTPAWIAVAPALIPPSGREGATAIYDPERDRMIVFGGYNGAVRNDVWALHLTPGPAWNALSPTGDPPSGREGHTAIYDPGRDRMVVFGGEGGGTSYEDLWALSLAGVPTWNALSPTGMLPPERYGHTAILDPMREQMLTFGGVGRSDVFRLSWGSLVAVDPLDTMSPTRFQFASPRPNPTRSGVSFDIVIPHASQVSLLVYDSAGRMVRSITDSGFAAGRHVLTWDRRNDGGQVVPSGIYFVRLSAPDVHLTRKAILIP